jgi:SAM-dependent methyltransferase
MAGSGTTLDVARSLGRRALGFDIAPRRSDIHRADARRLPLPDGLTPFVFVDPPYGDNLHYSDEPGCLGRMPCTSTAFYENLRAVAREVHRILRPGGISAWLVSDEYRRSRFTPVGFLLFCVLVDLFQPVDIVAVARRGDRSLNPHWAHISRRRNFLLRGFKYLLIMRKGGRP